MYTPSVLGQGEKLKQTVLVKYAALESTLTDIFINNGEKFMCTFSESLDENTEFLYDMFTKPVDAI